MKEENKKEEIQSRREFFKNAAKKGLPIVAAIALAGMPVITEAEPTGCRENTCHSTCYGTCEGTCEGRCRGYCDGLCRDDCHNGCKDGCKGTCKNSSK